MPQEVEDKTKGQSRDASTLENAGRRKAVKTIVGGITTVAAYNMLPAKWGIPIIESVFLPAHAATSGTSLHDPCTVTITKGDQSTTVHFRIDGYVVPAVKGLPVNLEITTIGTSAGTTSFPSTLTNLVTDANGEFSEEFGQWPIGSERVEVTTTVEGADGSATCWANIGSTGDDGSTDDDGSTSVNTCSESDVVGTWSTEVEIDPGRDAVLTLSSGGTATRDNGDTGTWSMTGNTVTIITTFTEDGSTGTDTYIGTLGTDCNSMTGTASSEVGSQSDSGTFSASKNVV